MSIGPTHTCGGGCGSPTPPDDEDSEFPSASTNPCKLCTPLGACLAFKGIAGAVPLLHGSQGCATYIRRYLISHYREPMDIASSNFSEDSAIFGGQKNLHTALDNVIRQYEPGLVGIATTCLSETMGENMPLLIGEYREANPDRASSIVHVSTPSFRGTHADGFHAAVRSLVETLAGGTDMPPANPGRLADKPVALFPGMVSPADIRHLKDIVDWFGAEVTIVPDYSESLDGPSWSDYEPLPAGGTPVDAIKTLDRAPAALELGRALAGDAATAGTHLQKKFGVPHRRLGLPVGLRETDAFLAALAEATGTPVPQRLIAERGRLVDSYVDCHKYTAGKRAVIYGEEDFVVAVAAFLAETGVTPVLCATGGRRANVEQALFAAAPELRGKCLVRTGADFHQIEAEIERLQPDLLVGSSKGYKLARRLGIPLVRCGFPVHDRAGAQRIQILGYTGTQQLFDRVVNALLEAKQENSDIGYSYL